MAQAYVKPSDVSSGVFYDDGGAGQRLASQIESESNASSREDCKLRIGEMKKREARAEQLKAEIATVNVDLEKAQTEFFAKAEPIQLELRQLDPLDKTTAPRRLELRHQLAEHNLTLEEIAKQCNDKIGALKQELADPALNFAALHRLQSALTTEFADPEKRARMKATLEIVQLFTPTLREFDRDAGELRVSLEIAREESSPLDPIQRQLDRLELRRSILNGVASQLQQQADQLFREIRDE